MPAHTSIESLEQVLRHALQYLYDPAELRKSQLLDLLGVAVSYSPLTQARRLLTDAIEALKPESSVPLEANAWRIYNILTYRYVERLNQREAAEELNLSVRQLRRDEHAAMHVLAHHLYYRYHLDAPDQDENPATGAPPDAVRPGQHQELEWMRQSFASEALDLIPIVQASLDTAAPLIQDAGVEIVVAASPNLSPVMGQATAIRQALLSLLSMAVRAAPGGCIEIQAEDDEDGVRLTVCATYEGAMAPEIDSEMAKTVEISRQLIEVGGGRLQTVASTTDCAYLIQLSFPDASHQARPVLVVDDNADTMQLFRRFMSGTPFEPTGVSHPQEALAGACLLHPQVIILDVMLPGVDGWELLGRLRAHPETRDIPVIVCTILPQENLALALGAAAFLQKPFNRASLFETLATTLNL